MGHPRCQMNVAPRHVASQVAAASAGVFGEQNQGAAGLGAPCGVWGRRLPLPPSPARSPALAEPQLLDLSPSQAPRWLGHAELSPPVLVQLQWAQPAGGMRCQGDQVWVDAGGRGFSYPPQPPVLSFSSAPALRVLVSCPCCPISVPARAGAHPSLLLLHLHSSSCPRSGLPAASPSLLPLFAAPSTFCRRQQGLG